MKMKKIDKYDSVPTAWLRRSADNDFWLGALMIYVGATAVFIGVFRTSSWGLAGLLCFLLGLLLSIRAGLLLRRSAKLREISDWREFGE